ncbi:hypothetical protein ACFWPU_00725 [Streptomyces sp. NPDC058471]|uniref:DUF6197 family protein n=1 Tax=Streptomyces sp. NPDC058471 TaxID=3346516 RepID=UPI003651F209
MNIFEKAAQVLMEGGHCKGELADGEGRHCAMGALHMAEMEKAWSVAPTYYADVAASRAADRLAERGELPPLNNDEFMGFATHPLARWNDAPERTGEDVIMLFKELGAERE